MTIHWACGLDISKIMTYEIPQRFGQTQLAARKMFIAWYDIQIQNHQTQTHEYHQWSSPWFSWFKSYYIFVHQKTALLFLARERVRIPFLVLQSLFYEVFLDHGLPKKKESAESDLGHVFQDKFGIGFINQTVDEEKSGSPVDIGRWYTILFFVGFHVWQCRRIPFSKFLQLMRETCLLQHKGFLRVLLHP